MKKVLALVLAVLMLGTVAFAAQKVNNVWYSDVTPGSSIKITRDGVKDAERVTVNGTLENGTKVVFQDSGKTEHTTEEYLLRSVNSENYSISSVKYKVGKSLVEGVKINDKEDRVEIALKDDLNNTNAKNFEVSFKLKGKSKFTIRDAAEIDSYNAQVSENKMIKNKDNLVVYVEDATKDLMLAANSALTDAKVKKLDPASGTDEDRPEYYFGKQVSLPDVNFVVIGTVGYGKVEVSLGDAGDEDFENLQDVTIYTNKNYGAARENPRAATATSKLLGVSSDTNTNTEPANDYIDIDRDIIKFISGGSGTAGMATRAAGAYTADAILIQEYNDALTLEARVYKNDTLYFSIDNAPVSNIVSKLADVNADIDFYLFNEDKDFTTFNSTATLKFTTADSEEDFHVYEIVNGGLAPRGEFDDDEGCWILRTRTLGQYVVSSEPLELYEVEAGDDTANANPDTGANDVVGIATALAAVALVSAAAISLKK